jgi:hypothetical protein
VTRILKKDAERLLDNAVDDHVFRCHDGRIMKSMQELRDALNMMSEETYTYHANVEKNDFSKWVREIIGDQKLANDLVKSTGRIQATKAVTNRLVFLSSKLE